MIATVFLLLWSTNLHQASISIPMADMNACNIAIAELDKAGWIVSVTGSRAICIKTGLKP